MRYFITDHLGSVRAVVNADGEIVEQNDYMPYGTLHANSALQKTDNRYLYGGKELQTDFGVNYYDSFARFQRTDGAFNSIDPLAEKLYGASPYAYCFGNPIVLQDPNGKLPIIPILWGLYEVGSAIYDAYTTYQTLSDENATTFDKVTALGGVLASAVLPGGGYTTVSKVDDVTKIAIRNSNEANSIATIANKTSRSARREVMRKESIPTSQQPISQSKNASGMEYTYEVYEGGKSIRKSVQQQTLDESHLDQPHWEAGAIKTHNGEPAMNLYGRPRLTNSKSKEYYNR